MSLYYGGVYLWLLALEYNGPYVNQWDKKKNENQEMLVYSFILQKKDTHKLKNHMKKKLEAKGTVPRCVIVSQTSKIIQNRTNFIRAAITFQCKLI